ncbi:MAG: glycosyltransferase family 29 protein [Desulforhopalus sp.]
MKGTLTHSIKRNLPYRKLTQGIQAIEKKIQWSGTPSQYWKSICAMKAGLWHDDYFIDFKGFFDMEQDRKTLVLAIEYKRIKYGWTLDELLELVESRAGKKHINHPSFCVLIASLFHEIGHFEKTLEFLPRALSLKPDAIDGYLGLSSFALQQHLPAPCVHHENHEKLQLFFSRFQNFTAFFKNELSGKKIAVIGNGDSETGSSKGALIDSQDHVFRFNNFPEESMYEKDYGKKTTVWVRNPSIHEVPLRQDFQPATIIFSSPLMLHTKNGNWKWILKHCNTDQNLVLFDVSVFRDLVQTLHAPPSAGLLAICNIAELSDDLSHIHLQGFDFNTGQRSHYFDNQKPTSRHNWAAEKNVFSKITERPVVYENHR